MTKDKKLSDFDRRKLHYQELWGLNEKPLDKYEGDLRSDMRRWVAEADSERADSEKKKVATAPKKIDVDSITKSRVFYENLMKGGEND